jgi:hypothetical protein
VVFWLRRPAIKLGYRVISPGLAIFQFHQFGIVENIKQRFHKSNAKQKLSAIKKAKFQFFAKVLPL